MHQGGITIITSLQNEQVKYTVSLHSTKGRKTFNEYIVEGKRLVNEAFIRKAPIRKVYYVPPQTSDNDYCSGKEESVLCLIKEANRKGISTEEVTDNVMRKMSATEEPQGILAILSKTDFTWEDIIIRKDSVILIIDGIQDPGNLGTILRTALAADVSRIILTKGTVDLHSPKVLRSSMGAVFSQCILTEKTPQEIENFCLENSLRIAVCTMEGDSIFAQNACAYYPMALVIGNEAFGPSEYFMTKANTFFSIPMSNNVESLNAAMAAGIFLFELKRQVQFL